jgi:hypothetical protein
MIQRGPGTYSLSFGHLLSLGRELVDDAKMTFYSLFYDKVRHNILFPVIAIQIMFKWIVKNIYSANLFGKLLIGHLINTLFTTLKPKKKKVKSLMVAVLRKVMLNGVTYF